MKRIILLVWLLVAMAFHKCDATTFSNIYLPGVWPAATWWTNSPAETNIYASNAWHAVNENFTRTSNSIAPVRLLAYSTNRAIDVTAQTNIWEDINFSPSGMNPVGLAGAATLVLDAGPAANMLALDFGATGTDVAAVNPQMSHTWTGGTTVYPHIHVLPKTTGDGGVVWQITAMSADIGSTMITNAVVTQTNTLAGGTNQHRHLLWNLPAAGIELTNAVGPSTMQLLRIERLGDDDGDTYAGAISVIGFDVHYRWGGSPIIYSP